MAAVLHVNQVLICALFPLSDPTPGSETKWPRLNDTNHGYMILDEVAFADNNYHAKWVGPGNELVAP